MLVGRMVLANDLMSLGKPFGYRKYMYSIMHMYGMGVSHVRHGTQMEKVAIAAIAVPTFDPRSRCVCISQMAYVSVSHVCCIVYII